MSWLSSLTGKRKSEGGFSGGVEKLARGVRQMTIEDSAAAGPSTSALTAGIFEDDAVVVDVDDPEPVEPSASAKAGKAEHVAAGQNANAQQAQPADMIHVDGPDALEPSASGMAEHTAGGEIPNVQQARPADMVPEVSDSVQGATSEVPDTLEHLNGMGEEKLQQELTKAKAAIDKAEVTLQNLELVQGLLRATKPSIHRTINEACARMMRLSQLQYKMIQCKDWKATRPPLPCFDHQVAGAAYHLEQELLSIMEATGMEAVEQALGELGCPGSLHMDCEIIRIWIEEMMNERQQYCVEMATLERDLEEAEERESALKADLHHLKVQLDTINRLLLDLQVQSMVPALSAMGSTSANDVP